VLARMSRAFGSASAALVSRLVPARRVWDSATDERHEVVDAVGLEIASSTGKSGWKLSLSGADAASTAMLETLGLNKTAQPGSAARAVIGGEERTSASGLFSADSGRMTIDVRGTFGEAAPVRVSAPLAELSEALADVLASYNEVTDLLARNKGEVQPGALQGWTSTAAQRSAALRAIGVEQTGQSLWLSEQDFLTAALAQPETVQDVLSGSGGLLPALKDQTERALSGGVESWLSAQASAKAGQGGLDQLLVPLKKRTELEVEKASQLLDLYDTGGDFGLATGEGASGRSLVSRKG